MTSPLDHVGRDEPVRPEALSQPRRRARSAVENVSAAAIAPPAVRRAYTAPEPRRARQLIEVSSTTAEEIGSSASFLPRVSIRLDQPDASGDDAGRRSRVSLVVRRRPQPGKVVTTTVSIDQRVVIFAALLSLAASAVGLPVSGGDAASQPPQVAGSGLHEFAETSWLDTRAAPQLDNVSLDSGISLLGQPWALDRLFARLTAGNPVTIGVLGASVAQNAGCLDQGKSRCMSYNGRKGAAKKGWAVRLLEAINATWPHASHRISNGALDATPVSTASSCLFSHLTEKVDLVLLEWGSMGLHNEAPMEMRHLEKVARALLSLAEPPLLLHISVREWCSQRVGPPRQLYTVGEMLYGRLRSRVYPDSPWWRVELEADRVSSYYGQAALSVHEAVYPRVLRKEPGFALADVTGDDCLHPANGRHGISFIAQLLERWLVQAHDVW